MKGVKVGSEGRKVGRKEAKEVGEGSEVKEGSGGKGRTTSHQQRYVGRKKGRKDGRTEGRMGYDWE